MDLVIELRKVSVREALHILEGTGLGVSRGTYSPLIHPVLFETACSPLSTRGGAKRKYYADEKEKDAYFVISKVQNLQHPSLISYLESRRINPEIARHHLKEIYFKPKTQLREYFSLGWPNGNGYEARSQFFKGFVGTGKDISVLNPDAGTSLAIFEGYIDFLSFLSYRNMTDFKNAAIILNSTALRDRAKAFIESGKFRHLFLYLDNDEAGESCKDFYELAFPDMEIIDRSPLYAGYKDFNAWWCSHID